MMPIPTLLADPEKPMMSYSSVPLAAVTTISTLIIRDEGGWVISSESDNSDGGWTYGGMTSRSFSEYFLLSKEELTRLAVDPNTQTYLRQAIVVVYYMDYYIPALKILPGTHPLLLTSELSCAINCGLGGFESILKDQSKTGKSFLECWVRHYVAIVQANPAKAIDENGWISRVFRYVAPAV